LRGTFAAYQFKSDFAYYLVICAQALGGAFYAQYLQYVEPHTFADVNIVVEIILFTVVGGAGTVWGPVIGPMLLIPAGELLRHALGGGLPGVHLLAYGLLLVTVIRSAKETSSQ
jgi:branched-chain amino acid transport system permease protein